MEGHEDLRLYQNRETRALVRARQNPHSYGLSMTLVFDGKRVRHYTLRAGQWEVFDDWTPMHEMMADMPFRLKYIPF